MKKRLFLWIFGCLAFLLMGPGCDMTSQESVGSNWLGVTSSADGVATSTSTVTTATPTLQIAVVPAQVTVRQGESTPISVTLAGASSPENLTVAMSSTLGGTFDPAKGTGANGAFSTTWTAPTTTSGTTVITALVGGTIGTTAVQILPIVTTPDQYLVTVLPTDLTLGWKQSTTLSVKVANQKGDPIDKAEVLLHNSLDGTFGEAKGTTSQGVFSTTFTSGITSGTCTITATSMGATGTAAIQVVAGIVPSIILSQATMTTGTSQTVTVKVTNERGILLSGFKAFLTSQAGGTFDKTSEDVTDGFCTFTYTAPALPAAEILTVQVQDVFSTQALTIQ